MAVDGLIQVRATSCIDDFHLPESFCVGQPPCCRCHHHHRRHRRRSHPLCLRFWTCRLPRVTLVSWPTIHLVAKQCACGVEIFSSVKGHPYVNQTSSFSFGKYSAVSNFVFIHLSRFHKSMDSEARIRWEIWIFGCDFTFVIHCSFEVT